MTLIYIYSLFFPSCDLEKYATEVKLYLESSHLEISRPWAKAIIFIFASGQITGPIPQFVFKLINRWAAIPSKIYTNHVGFVNWMLQLQQGCVFQETQTAMVVKF